MASVHSNKVRLERGSKGQRSGVTLLEVLVAILITGVGLLALLVLFPLGALEMARAVKDDRAAGIARDAVTLSINGAATLSETGDFVSVSLATGSADPTTAARIREKYEALAVQSADLEFRLRELRSGVSDPRIQRRLDRLVTQVRSMKRAFDTLSRLLRTLEQGSEIPVD